jgi:hypothetical protein
MCTIFEINFTVICLQIFHTKNSFNITSSDPPVIVRLWIVINGDSAHSSCHSHIFPGVKLYTLPTPIYSPIPSPHHPIFQGLFLSIHLSPPPFLPLFPIFISFTPFLFPFSFPSHLPFSCFHFLHTYLFPFFISFTPTFSCFHFLHTYLFPFFSFPSHLPFSFFISFTPPFFLFSFPSHLPFSFLSYPSHLRGVLGNKCAGQHNLKTVQIREIM